MTKSVLLLIPLYIWVVASASQDAFNMKIAYDQLMLSYAAYCPQDQIQSWSCYFCQNNSDVQQFKVVTTVYNATTNIFGYVGYTGSIAQVIFRGTQETSLINWIENLNYSHSSPYPTVPNGYVHSGFLDAWYSVRSGILAGVKQLYSLITPTEFYFSGHSLGAALSILATMEIGVPLSIPVTCYNFGDPRVGNTNFAQYFNEHVPTTYRIVNQHDIVPHLPPKDFGFWHIATEVWWENSTYYKICDDSGEDPTCSDSVFYEDVSVADHLDYLNVPLASGAKYGCS